MRDKLCMRRLRNRLVASSLEDCFRGPNRSTLEALARAGAFDSTNAHRSQVTAVIDRALSMGTTATADRAAGQMGLFGAAEAPPTTSDYPDIPEWPEREREPHASLLRLYRATLAVRREWGLGRLERGEYRVTGEGGELVLEARPSGDDPVLVIVRLGGAGVLESSENPLATEVGWRVLLTTEETAFAVDPSPPHVGTGSPWPQVAFRRAGAVVLTRA